MVEVVAAVTAGAAGQEAVELERIQPQRAAVGVDEIDERELVGEDPDIVFEHPGRQTFGASVFVVKRGGKVVTCASTSGYMHVYDNRYLWMNLKSIIGSHFANYKEAWESNRLADLGMIHPILSKTYPLAESGEAAYQVHHNLHTGKLGILVLAPEEGQGVRNEERRAQHREKIEAFRRFSD